MVLGLKRQFFLGQKNKSFTASVEAISNAILRPETGAVINDQEAERKIRELIPTANDGEVVIRQKLKGIRIVLGGLMAEAGPTAISQTRTQIANAAALKKAPKTVEDKTKAADALKSMTEQQEADKKELEKLRAGK